MTKVDGEQVRVAIGVCTCQRLEGLQRLLSAIDRLRLEGLAVPQVVVVVVDNSAEGYARALCCEYQRSGRFHLDYVHEPRRGLSFARNAMLDAAIAAGAAFLASIDDDEMPSPDWLARLLARQAESGDSLVIGPAQPLFEQAPPSWLPIPAYETRREPVAGYVTDGYTCNALIALSAVVAVGARFDARFNASGGEDTAFFNEFIARGYKIAWAEDAHVYDSIPASRMRLSWLLRRWYVTGVNEAAIDAGPAGSPFLAARGRSLLRGLLRVGAGSARITAAMVVHGWRRPERLVLSCYTAMRGLGFLAAAVGRRARGYAEPGYS
jgi:glycosyltransferase involved in cell wall biosynthesis